MALLLKSFNAGLITVKDPTDGDIQISYQIAGEGPPLLLLHGFPETKAIWHLVAPELTKHFTIVATDLRGYGASSKPPGQSNHSTYSKRSMAADQASVMKQLGFDHYFVLGHDRGGRVGHRLAADFPDQVKKLMVLDISPTLAMYEQTTMQFAGGYWHWFFLIQKEPIPERMIGADVDFFMTQFMGGRHAGLRIFDPACWQEYLEAMKQPECLHAMCEDYRASFTIDLEHDRIDIAKGFKLPMPMKVMWGKHGQVNACFSPIKDWERVANHVFGNTVDCGHYIPEEMPNIVIKEAIDFFK
jgi:haloacetate dehalogenase